MNDINLSDYKIEKAIISMLGQIEKKGKIRKVYILVDDASSLKPEGIEFVAKIMDFDVVRTLLTIPNNHITQEWKIYLKFVQMTISHMN